ncbi:MIP/aquaporin family protein [Xanthobacteraceae bacterium A53D]
MHTPFIGELMGTLVLILLGNGVVAGVLLAHSKAQNSGWIVITAGWAFAVMAGVFTATATGSPDAHLNPAVTLGAAVVTGDWSKLPVYVPAQMIGAFLGGVLVWLQYLPHWAPTQDKGLKLAVFCTGPAIRNAPANIISEIIGTIVLVFVIAAIFSKAVMAGAGIPAGLGPYIVGMLVWAIGLSLGGTTGYAINPARDLGPRIAHAILPIAGKGGSDWGYSWIPVVGPLVGALIAGVMIKIFI